MSAALLWQVIWPWLFYELLLALISLLLAGAIGDMGVMFISMTVASAVLYPVYFFREGRFFQRRFPGGKLCLAVTGTAVSAALFLNLFLFVMGLTQSSGSYGQASQTLFSAPLWLQLVVMGAAAPLCEEVIFRGLVYRRIRREKGAVIAAVLSALLFAAYHGNLPQGIYAGCLGLLLALACECGLWAAVWFHSCVNLLSVGGNSLLSVCPSVSVSRGVCLLLLAVSGAGMACGSFYLVRRLRAVSEDTCVQK